MWPWLDPSLASWGTLSSVLFFSRPRSEGWSHHGRTFSIYPLSTSGFVDDVTLPIIDRAEAMRVGRILKMTHWLSTQVDSWTLVKTHNPENGFLVSYHQLKYKITTETWIPIKTLISLLLSNIVKQNAAKSRNFVGVTSFINVFIVHSYDTCDRRWQSLHSFT